MGLTAVRYRRVAITGAAAWCAAGDAAMAWQAIVDRRSRLQLDPEHGWLGPAPDLPIDPPARLTALLERSLAALPGSAPAGAGPPCLAVGTSKGDTGRWLAGAPDPASWPGSWPGSVDAWLARRLGQRWFRPCAPVAACSTGLYALLAAADALEHDLATWAVAGAADSSLQPLLLAGFTRLGVTCRNRRPEALTGAGTGFAAGEGAGLLTLGRGEHSAWRLTAGVRAGDASHPTRCDDPAVLAAVLQALWDASPEPDAIVTHATGTAVGDAYEATGLDGGPWRTAPRICAKPLIGHCLGASGAVELAIALRGPHRRIWKLGLGFGGHIAAVACERDTAAPNDPAATRPDNG